MNRLTALVPQELLAFLLSPEARDLRPVLLAELTNAADLLLRDRLRRAATAAATLGPRRLPLPLGLGGLLPALPALSPALLPPVPVPGRGFMAPQQLIDELAPPLNQSEEVYLQVRLACLSCLFVPQQPLTCPLPVRISHLSLVVLRCFPTTHSPVPRGAPRIPAERCLRPHPPSPTSACATCTLAYPADDCGAGGCRHHFYHCSLQRRAPLNILVFPLQTIVELAAGLLGVQPADLEAPDVRLLQRLLLSPSEQVRRRAQEWMCRFG